MYLPHVVCGWLCSSDMVLLVMWYRWYKYSGDMVLLVNRCQGHVVLWSQRVARLLPLCCLLLLPGCVCVYVWRDQILAVPLDGSLMMAFYR